MIQDKLDKLFIVVPAKNEQNRIGKVLDTLQELGFKNVVVVNDGSDDDTCTIAKSYSNVTLLTHVINLGPGASTLTGIKHAVSKNAEYVLTIDADNQHNPNDIAPLVETLISNEADMAIGSRFLKTNNIPFLRIFYNKFGNIISFLLTGMYLTDSQSGMKVMNRKFASELNIDFNGFEFCIEIIKNASELNAKVVEYPIDVSYTTDTLNKGQNLSNGFSMLAKLFSPFSY